MPEAESVASIFSKPYGVYIEESHLEELGIEKGEPVTLTFKTQGEEKEIHAKANSKEDFDFKKEYHALFYGISHIIESLPEKLEEQFSQFQGEAPNEIEIDDPKPLHDYLEQLSFLNGRLQEKDIFVGCGFFDLFLKGERDPEDLVENLFFSVEMEILRNLLNDNLPLLESVEPFTGEIGEPEKVLICTQEFAPSEKQKNGLLDKFKELELLQAGNYILPYHFITSHGPVGVQGLEGDPELVRITEGSIDFTYTRTGEIWPEEERKCFDLEILEEGLKEIFEEDIIEVYPDDNLIKVLNVMFFANPYFIKYSYQHADEGLSDLIEDMAENLFKVLSDKLDFDLVKTPSPAPLSKLSDFVDTSVFVLDTSAVYHQVVDNEPSSIMEFFLPNWNAYDKRFKVPWQVLCEINRHKDADSSSTRKASEQGVQNLKILKMLDDRGFLELDIDDIPSQIDSSILTGTGATDIGIMSTVKDEIDNEEDAVLLTSDDRLGTLCSIGSLPALDIKKLSVGSIGELEEDPWDDVVKRIDINPSKKKKVIDETAKVIDERLESRENLDTENIDTEEKAEKWVEKWEREKRILPFPKQGGEMLLAKSEEFDVVPTYSLIPDLTDYITDSNYLGKKFFDIMNKIADFKEHPRVNFRIPEMYIHRASGKSPEEAPEGMEKDLFRLYNVKNADYTPVSIENLEELDLGEIAVRAAKENNCILLCGEDEKSLSRLGSLLGVTIREFSN